MYIYIHYRRVLLYLSPSLHNACPLLLCDIVIARLPLLVVHLLGHPCSFSFLLILPSSELGQIVLLFFPPEAEFGYLLLEKGGGWHGQTFPTRLASRSISTVLRQCSRTSRACHQEQLKRCQTQCSHPYLPPTDLPQPQGGGQTGINRNCKLHSGGQSIRRCPARQGRRRHN